MENTKRDLSLDFTKPRHPRGGGGQTMSTLVTPILNLSTPELNKMISEDELAVLTPNGISSVIPQSNILPSPLIPTTVNSNNIINSTNNHGNQNNNSFANTNNNLQNSNKCNGINRNHNDNGQKKRSDRGREVDIEKIEKKRERNRLAAKKCRQRKLETIEELKKTVSEWEQKYQRLNLAFEEFKNLKSRDVGVLQRENAELKGLLARRQ